MFLHLCKLDYYRAEAGIMRRDTACNFNAFILNQSIFISLITGASSFEKYFSAHHRLLPLSRRRKKTSATFSLHTREFRPSWLLQKLSPLDRCLLSSKACSVPHRCRNDFEVGGGGVNVTKFKLINIA